MQNGFILAAFLGACACGAADAGPAPQSQQSILSNATSELGRSLLAAHATFDGAPVTNLRPTAPCEAVIVTARGAVPIRWKDLGNLAPRLNGNQTIFSIPAGGRSHILSARTGRDATGIDMGLGLLDQACGGA